MSPLVEGVRDLLPGEVRNRRSVYQRIREIFALSGYQEVVTPTLESLDLYQGAETFFLKEEMFKIIDENGQILVLKPDVTMPIARMAATQFREIPKPWKFSYITTAYLGNRGQKAKMKEKTQAGIELMGVAGLVADAEVISLLVEVLKRVGIEDPLIDIGHAALVAQIFAKLPLTEEQKQQLRSLMDEKNLQGIWTKIQDWPLTSDQRKIIIALPKLFGEPEGVLLELKKLPLDEQAQEVVQEMAELYSLLQGFKSPQISFDPCMMTKLGYYTGIIFKAYIPGCGEVVASGGRYDGLTKQFGQDVPAVGFAMEIERLLSSLTKISQMCDQQQPRLVFKLSAKDDILFLQQLAQKLRKGGITVEIIDQLNITSYCQYHQIPYFCQISDVYLMLMRIEDNQRFYLTGELAELSDQLEKFLLGGRDD